MYHRFLILITFVFNVAAFQSIPLDDQVSFAVDLIHRDSPESPFYKQSRVYRLNSTSAYMDNKSTGPSQQENRKLLWESEIMINDRNDYFLQSYFGSDKESEFLFVDLTTNFVWTKCDMGFRTAQRVRSNTHFCNHVLDVKFKVSRTSFFCHFKYKDIKRHSMAKGMILKDRLYFSESQTDAPSIFFGCDNSDRHGEFDIGVLGLARGQASFISQLDRVYRFSYCLLPFGSSKIIFGNLDPGMQRILVPSPLAPDDKFYHLNLESVEVGDRQFDAPRGSRVKIDFGIKWTFIEENLYEKVLIDVMHMVQRDPIHRPVYSGLCYEKEDVEHTDFSFIFHFQGGASIEMNSKSLFADEYEDKRCMTIRKVNNREPRNVIGSIAQMGHVIQFDLRNKRASIAQVNCNLLQL